VNPVQNSRVAAEWRSMTADEQRQLRRSCAGVLASPNSYEADLTALCRFVGRVSAR
jgi:hypothetical protein